MSDIRMGAGEARFAELIWENEPIPSGSLARLALEALNWKKTTAFTVLKRLCDRGLFQNEGGTVKSLMSREEYYAKHSAQYVEENSPYEFTVFLGYAVQHLGYLPNEAAWEYGSYEADITRWEKGFDRILQDQYITMLNELYNS